MTHEFFEVNGIKVREIRFNGETELEQNYAGVHPRVMVAGTVDVHVWLPPRNGADGKPIETSRLRFFTVPVGAKGPLVSEIAQLIDESRMPKEVSIEKIEIPPEIMAMKSQDLDTFAPQVGAEFTEGMTIDGKRAVIARKCTAGQPKEILARLTRQRKPETVGA